MYKFKATAVFKSIARLFIRIVTVNNAGTRISGFEMVMTGPSGRLE